MRKILLVAKRDFLATVTTKGFIIAIMVPVVTFAAIVLAFPRMMNNRVPAITGKVAVIDQTGQVAQGIRLYLDPQAMAERRDALFNRAIESGPMRGAPAGADTQRAALGELPQFAVGESSLSALDDQKEQLTHDAPPRQLAVLVIHPNAVIADDEGVFGAYDLFVRRNLDSRIQNEIRNAATEAIVEARVRVAGLDR